MKQINGQDVTGWYSLVRRLHSGGTVELLPEYQVFQAPPASERHLFHTYVEKAVADTGTNC